jgi:DNA sulfur modification protein DndE
MPQNTNKGPSWTMPEVLLPEIPDRTFQVTDFGASGDGLTDNTDAFHQAIQACADAGGGRVVVPAGIWRTGPLKLASRLELHVEEGAVIQFSTSFDDYPLVSSSYEGRPAIRCQSPLDGDGLEHVAITGAGVFDGGGDAWRPVLRSKLTEKEWEAKLASGGVVDEAGETWWPSEAAMHGRVKNDQLQLENVEDAGAYQEIRDYLRPNLMSMRHSSRILLDGPTFQNSPAWCLHPWVCEHVTIREVTVRNPWYSQNGDGLDIESCRYVSVNQCRFDVGDDAICLKSGKDEAGRALGKPSEYIDIRDCKVYHGHGGVVIGSEMSGGVRYVSVSNCTFMGTEIGLRFKSARGRGGVVEDIHIERIQMSEIKKDAISFHLFYVGKSGSGSAQDDLQPIDEGTPVFRGIHIQDVICSGADTALIVNGLPEMPLENLTIRGYTVSADRGFVCHHMRGALLEKIDLRTRKGPVVKLHQCYDIKLDELSGECLEEGGQVVVVSGDRSGMIEYRGHAVSGLSDNGVFSI